MSVFEIICWPTSNLIQLRETPHGILKFYSSLKQVVDAIKNIITQKDGTTRGERLSRCKHIFVNGVRDVIHRHPIHILLKLGEIHVHRKRACRNSITDIC